MALRKYWLYAIRLDDAVLERPKFVRRNPDYKADKPCYYIGSSIYPPKVRFEKHKARERSSWWVREYGLHPSYKKCFQIEAPNDEERKAAERDYANELRRKGYGIWQN